MNYFKTEKRTAFIAVLLIFVIFLPFSVHSAYADDAETVNSWPQAPSVYGASAILMDADSGAILYASNAHERLYPASITKLLTTLVALDHAKLTDKVEFSQDSISFLQYGDAHIGMRAGEELTLEDSLYAVLLASANEVSYAVAESVGKQMGGDYNTFIEAMNEESDDFQFGLESYDAVGEFINCIDGLFSSALSNENIDIEILPQFAYENQIAKGNAYVLPIYINGCEVSLYIAVDSDVTIGQMPVTRKLAVKAGSVDEGDKHTVLIVDDSGMSRMMLRNILEDAGYCIVAEASDGLEGELAYKQYAPDVVTLDITMPNMDGIECLEKIMDYDPDANVIMITAAGQQNKVIKALKEGAKKFITKPYNVEDVLKNIGDMVE